jgi:hypothetical protein
MLAPVASSTSRNRRATLAPPVRVALFQPISNLRRSRQSTPFDGQRIIDGGFELMASVKAERVLPRSGVRSLVRTAPSSNLP